MPGKWTTATLTEIAAVESISDRDPSEWSYCCHHCSIISSGDGNQHVKLSHLAFRVGTVVSPLT